jgi:hypothetical protein
MVNYETKIKFENIEVTGSVFLYFRLPFSQ